MDMIFSVENIKCGGCAMRINNRLMQMPGVLSVSVDIKEEYVLVTASENNRVPLAAVLAEMGYPEKGSTEGLIALQAKLKSYVSCAIGQIDKVNKKLP